MTEPFNPLAFARELADFEEHLRWAAQYHDNEFVDIIRSYQALLGALAGGDDPATAITKAIRVSKDVQVEARAHRDRSDALYREANERRLAEDEHSRTAECPHCGADPGIPCHSTGSNGRYPISHIHKARFRLARSLNDGPSSEDVTGLTEHRRAEQSTPTPTETRNA